MPSSVIAASLIALAGGDSEPISISSTSAQSSAITSGSVQLTPTVTCFFRQGLNPTALSNGTDQILLANNTYRIVNIKKNAKLAFKTSSASGTVYISPGA